MQHGSVSLSLSLKGILWCKKTYIEVHIGGAHGKPFMIHKLECYAIEKVKCRVILCQGKSQRLVKKK